MIPSTYPPKDEIARLTARMLLEIGAVHFNADTPFTLASGLPSPTYIDCRKLISYPRIRSTLMDFLTVTVLREAGFEAFDNIAGGETAGIPFAALVAERMALPMTYVRKKPKGYGRNARIEGAMTEGQRVLLVEERGRGIPARPPEMAGGAPEIIYPQGLRITHCSNRQAPPDMVGCCHVDAGYGQPARGLPSIHRVIPPNVHSFIQVARAPCLA